MSNDNWETPQWLFDTLSEEFKFTLDVCASRTNAKHVNYLTEKENALSQPWAKVNWCNPPYSKQMPWVEKAHTETLHGNTTVMLLMCDTSTKCFSFCAKYANEVRLLNRRIKFVGASGSPRFASMLVVFKPSFNRLIPAANIYVEFLEEILK